MKNHAFFAARLFLGIIAVVLLFVALPRSENSKIFENEHQIGAFFPVSGTSAAVAPQVAAIAVSPCNACHAAALDAEAFEGQPCPGFAKNAKKPPVVFAQAPEPSTNFLLRAIEWLRNDGWAWLLALIPLWEIVARLTPTQKDNTFLSLLKSWIDKLFPNAKTGGGTHA